MKTILIVLGLFSLIIPIIYGFKLYFHKIKNSLVNSSTPIRVKKHPHVNTQQYSGLFFKTGLVIALSSVFMAFTYETKKETQFLISDNLLIETEIEMMTPITRAPLPKDPEPPKAKKQVPIKISTSPEIIKDENPFIEKKEKTKIVTDNVVYKTEIIEEIPEIVEPPEPKVPFVWVEKMPEFVGGEAAMMKFISKNMKIPTIVRENDLQGLVMVQFVINEDGSISDIMTLRDIGGGAAEEVMRVVKSMPNWIPGSQRGKTVRVQFNLPVRIQLN